VHFDDWYKKQVTLRLGNVRFDLDVAQELFSSHEVDSGSLLLLRSLAHAHFPRDGRCLDYGCGYGILGLAWKASFPEWDVTLVDRDALAVAFSAHNARKLGYPGDCIGGLVPLDQAGTGYDLLLWNVPGKAGEPVLAELMADSLDVLAPGGLLGLVVVHPLTDTLRTVAANRAEFTIEYEEQGPEHTVLHIRRTSGNPQPKAEAFTRGVFDREPISVDHAGYAYSLTPVIGLPQYDGPNHPTLLMMDALAGLAAYPMTDIICIRPGTGHLPMAASLLWSGAAFTLVDRDLLALKASSRALSERSGNADRIMTELSPDLDGLALGAGTFDLAIVMIDHQMRPPVMRRLLEDIEPLLRSGSRLAFGGGSTEVSRMLSLARKRPELKIRDREKRKGFSATVINSR